MEQIDPLFKVRAQDMILSGALIAGAVFVLLSPSRNAAAGPARAAVYHRGEIVAELPLGRRAAKTLLLEAGAITIEVVPGKGVHISESNCPERVCVHAGWVGRPGETIACLPNKLLVEIEGENAEYNAVI